MRRVSRLSGQARGIAGVAPVLHFPSVEANPKQVEINTAKAIDMIRAQLGEKPAPFKRQHDTSFAQVKDEINTILNSCGSDESPLEDGKEVTQLQVIERVLRHGLCSYEKNEGTCSYEDMEKWLVYTATDAMEFNRLKKQAELQKDADAQADKTPLVPTFDWAAEYAAATDREIVAEKRKRYDAIAATTFERNEAEIEAELRAYKQPHQDELLETLIEQVQLFKPFLAKQVIQAKLIERNAEGQLTYSRFADWNPDARDVSELHVEAKLEQPGNPETQLPLDETMKRYADVRMKTKEEVLQTMDAHQQASMASAGVSAGADDNRRAQLLAEILRLQQKASSSSDDKKADDAAEAEVEEVEDDSARYEVAADVVKSKGLLGLRFLTEAEKTASA